MIKKGISIMIISCLLILITGCQSQDGSQQANLTEYRFTGYYDWFLGKEEYEDFMTYFSNDQSLKIDSQYGEKIYRDGEYLIIEATDEQKQALINQNKQLIEQATQEFMKMGEDYQMDYSDDYSSMTIWIDQEHFVDIFSSETFQVGGNMLGIISLVTASRVLTTGDCDSAVKIHIINLDSDYQVAEAIFPYESIQITSQDWLTSQQNDVTDSSKLEGYSRVLATVIEKNDNQIFFKPESTSSDYQKDEKLCLCLDSVYGEDVFMPYQLSKGDQVYLTLNGNYALHDDGDEIPDIAPMAIIPVQYIDDAM